MVNSTAMVFLVVDLSSKFAFIWKYSDYWNQFYEK